MAGCSRPPSAQGYCLSKALRPSFCDQHVCSHFFLLIWINFHSIFKQMYFNGIMHALISSCFPKVQKSVIFKKHFPQQTVDCVLTQLVTLSNYCRIGQGEWDWGLVDSHRKKTAATNNLPYYWISTHALGFAFNYRLKKGPPTNSSFRVDGLIFLRMWEYHVCVPLSPVGLHCFEINQHGY